MIAAPSAMQAVATGAKSLACSNVKLEIHPRVACQPCDNQDILSSTLGIVLLG